MRNATPTNKSKPKSDNEETSASKKLVQARLPFKLLAPGSGAAAVAGAATTPVTTPATTGKAEKPAAGTDTRKRKLSYESATDDDEKKAGAAEPSLDKSRRSGSKENIVDANTKKKRTEDVVEDDVILLDDSSDESETEKKPATTPKPSATKKQAAKPKSKTTTPKASKSNSTTTPKGKSNESTAASPAAAKLTDSAQKLQIKLPMSKRRKSARKSTAETVENENAACEEAAVATAESSDDIEMLAGELNPQKRTKIDAGTPKKADEQVTTELKKTIEPVKGTPKISDMLKKSQEMKKPAEQSPAQNKSKIESDSKNKEEKRSTRDSQLKSLEQKSNKDKSTNKSNEEKSKTEVKADKSNNDQAKEDKSSKPKSQSETKAEKANKKDQSSVKPKEDKPSAKPTEDKPSKDQSFITENEADDEAEAADKSKISSEHSSIDDSDGHSSVKSVNQNSNPNPKPAQQHTTSLTDSQKKNLTPKQLKLMEQRKKAREEKERKLAEERQQKQQEKEQKELEKKREREEREEQRRKEREDKEEQRRKEREEKEEQKRKERDEKERKRLAEIEAKNEEKRKRNEAKEEETRKKEEERKRKEQEKEEAEMKKQKAAAAFTKFFVAKTGTQNAPIELEQASNDSNSVQEMLAFRPFQIKGDMKVAPLCRKVFTVEAKQRMDELLHLGGGGGGGDNDDDEEEEVVRRKPLSKSHLYLAQLQAGIVVPCKWQRPAQNEAEQKVGDDDVIFIDDALERAGQEIIEETHPAVERHRAKFYKFHENRRPPYYGTWRKKSSKVTARRPFGQDQKFFDYEVDSDLEWEEEEPGESLDGSDDDKEKESEDEDYEVDNEWFVPHGHLSDEEMQNQDEIGGEEDTTREGQKAKLQLLQQEFAQEMKKKTEKIKPRLVGCVWVDENGNQPDNCPNVIWDMLELRAMLYTEPPIVQEPEQEPSSPSTGQNAENGNTAGSEKTSEKLKPFVITEELQKKLVHLVHGNVHSKAFLIKEFIAYVEANEESIKNGDVRGPLKSAVRDKIEEYAEWTVVEKKGLVSKNKNKIKKMLCWVVNPETLEKMNLSDLDIKNEWQYILPTKSRLGAGTAVAESGETEADGEAAANTGTPSQGSKRKINGEIKKFTTKLHPKEVKPLEEDERNATTPAEPAKSTVEKSTKEEANKSEKLESNASPNSAQPPAKKKRVALLMSVARGQQFATPAKNALISQFLKKSSEAREETAANSTEKSETNKTTTSETSSGTSDVIVLD